MQLANRKIKICFPILNIVFSNKRLNNSTPTQFYGEKFGIKTKVKIVEQYLQLMNMFHCLAFICLYEKTHKSASLLHFLISEAVTYVILCNKWASSLSLHKICLKMF